MLRVACLLLVAVSVPVVDGGTRAGAATGASAALAQPGAVARLVPSGDVAAASATLVEEAEAFNREQAEFTQQANAVIAEAERLTKEAAAADKDAEALNAKSDALDRETSSFNARADALSAKIDAHNSKPNTFELPRQAAAANAYSAEASRLNAEQSQLRAEQSSLRTKQSQLSSEQSKLSSRRSQLTAATEANDAKAGTLQSRQQQLVSQGQQLLQEMAEAVQSFAENPPDPAAALDQGGDAARPPQQSDQTQTQEADDSAEGGDTPSRLPQNAALKAYAQRTGDTVDPRPGTVYLSPSTIGALPQSQAARLTSPVVSYDGLVSNSDGTYTALRVQTSQAAGPAQTALESAVKRGRTTTFTFDGREMVFTHFITVNEEPESSSSGDGTASPSPSSSSGGKAECLTNKPGAAERTGGGGGWILNTAEGVPARNKLTSPPGPAGTRSGQAEACLERPLTLGKDAEGDITGFQDARIQQPSGNLSRCHLIARALGGKGNTQAYWPNLFPCWQVGLNTTRGSMRTYEQIVEEAVSAFPAGSGNAVYYVVTPHYRDGTSTIPDGVSVSATVQKADGSSWPLFDSITLLNIASVGGPNLGN